MGWLIIGILRVAKQEIVIISSKIVHWKRLKLGNRKLYYPSVNFLTSLSSPRPPSADDSMQDIFVRYLSVEISIFRLTTTYLSPGELLYCFQLYFIIQITL